MSADTGEAGKNKRTSRSGKAKRKSPEEDLQDTPFGADNMDLDGSGLTAGIDDPGIEMEGMKLGKVVKSNGHCDYVVQVDDRLEVADPPSGSDYGFGSFVKLVVEDDREPTCAVGVVYNTQLFNPSFLNTGPRLSSDPSPIFAPDLQTEIRTLLNVALVGTLEIPPAVPVDSRVKAYGIQGIPRLVVPVNTCAYNMTEDEVYRFHRDRAGELQFTYYGLLLNNGGPFSQQLICQVLDEVGDMFYGSQKRALEILSRELSWKITMGAMR
ncbi:MAG: hypothetical protein AB4040_08740 [Synechococcus sp.]